MADVNISKYRASVVRDGSKPATPGFVVSEGQDPVDPAGTGQNHLPVTIAPTATGLSITDSQILSGAGTVGQYIRGDGSLADFPSVSGGGSSVSYYLNGSVNQGTIGGVAYKELSKVPVLGTGTDFSINANGYIASFITDAGDPNLLEIPGGNWNFETYFSASSSGGTPTFYVELYKYNGTTFTLLASNSGSPELIAFGTTLTSYFSTLAVPTTTLALTDRLAIRYYVNHSGRTITLHTEDNHLCQVITTFTTGLTALNGLTAQVQNFAVGTSGTDFNIASATQTHTFNLPTASATNRGALSSADWTTFNNKQNALTLTTSGSSGPATLIGATLNIPDYGSALSGYVPTSRTLTINGTTFDLSANRTWSVGTVTSVAALTLGTSGTDLSSTVSNGTTTPVITLNVPTASATNRGALSSSDWTTFNNKIGGTLATGQVAFGTAANTIGGDNGLFWDNTNKRLGIGVTTPLFNLDVQSSTNTIIRAFGTSIGRLSLQNSTKHYSISVQGSDLFFFDETVSATRWRITSTGVFQSNGAQTIQTSTGNLTLATAGGNGNILLTPNGTGGVGINTNTPLGTLDIRVAGNGGSASNASNSIIISPLSISEITEGEIGSQIILNARRNGVSDGVSIASVMQSANFDLASMAFYTHANSVGTPRVECMRIFGATGDVLLQNGGTFTDAGFRLDVNGTARVQNKLSVGTPTAASAIMEVTSTTQGFLPPRMTSAQRTAIASPAEGLIVFQTDSVIGLYIYANATWRSLTMV